MHFTKIFLTALAFIFAAPSHAFYLTDELTYKQRLEVASKLLDSFNRLEQALVTLSPSDREWVESERNQVYGDNGEILNLEREMALSDTREYVVYETHSYLTYVLNSLQFILEQSDPKDVRKEMVAWSYVADALLQQTLSINASKLRKHEVIQSSVCDILEGTEADGFLMVWGDQPCWKRLDRGTRDSAFRIIRKIITPYLEEGARNAN